MEIKDFIYFINSVFTSDNPYDQSEDTTFFSYSQSIPLLEGQETTIGEFTSFCSGGKRIGGQTTGWGKYDTATVTIYDKNGTQIQQYNNIDASNNDGAWSVNFGGYPFTHYIVKMTFHYRYGHQPSPAYSNTRFYAKGRLKFKNSINSLFAVGKSADNGGE